MLYKDVIVTLRVDKSRFHYSHEKIDDNSPQICLYDALHYIANGDKYALHDLIFHNIPVRDRLRKVGLRQLLDEFMCLYSPWNMRDILDEFYRRWGDVKLAAFDIQLYSVADKVAILGGVVDLKSLIKGQKHSNSDGMPIYAAKAAYRYPCFDAEDYANEDRYYQYYILRDNPISAEEFADFKKRTEQLDEKTPPDLLPMAYYVGEGAYMLVATRKAQCDTDNAE